MADPLDFPTAELTDAESVEAQVGELAASSGARTDLNWASGLAARMASTMDHDLADETASWTAEEKDDLSVGGRDDGNKDD